MKYLNKFFFLAGIFFTSTLLHEYIHHLDCGGEFIAGMWWNGKVNLGMTWCARELKWGEWPNLVEISMGLYGLLNLKRVI